MADDRLCIICRARKPVSLFERKGEHIVPRFLGSRRLRTPHVCRECNGGLGGTVDVALKNVPGIAMARFDRRVAGAANSPLDDRPSENPDVKGAMLKIAYEAAHLRLGNGWLDDPAAVSIRNALAAYVAKNKEKARRLAGGTDIGDIRIDAFYYGIGRSRSELVRRAICGKSCLNGLWLAPLGRNAEGGPLAVILDIEGLPSVYVAVSDSNRGVGAPELLAPAH
jgi:hypothetical protein